MSVSSVSVNAIVLAAGQGTRMKSKKHKVLHSVCGKPMIRHILGALQRAGIERKIVVIGSMGEQLQTALNDDVEFVWQEQQLGTGHAVIQAAPLLQGAAGITLVCTGDTPLISAETFKNLIELHRQEAAAATILTGSLDNPFGYGRIIRDDDGTVLRIVEEKDCNAAEKAVHEVNSATYCFDTQLLLNALQSITNQNAQGEYYLTDCIDILRREGNRIAAYCVNDASEILGVNDRVQLAQVEHIFRQNIRVQHMRNGVTLVDPASIYIDTEVSIGADSVLLPGTILRGKTVIGSACEIGPNTEITDCQVGDETIITHSVLVESSIGDQVNMGPFAYIRPGSKIQNQAKIGDFVEVKNSTIGQGSKVPHLSYIGDADIGSGTNIGCGTITVNYDGISKHRTHVGNNAFIGCNSNLVAPVTVGDRAYIAAGSTITDNVPDGALGIARQRQATKEGYTEKLEARLRERRPQK